MLEPRRSRYLRALGIDIYVPRLVLPGALPSVECEWEAAPESDATSTAVAAAAVEAAAAALLQPEISSPQQHEPQQHLATRSPVPTIDLPSAPAPRRSEPAVKPAPVDAEATPRIALGIAVGGGILVVDDAPANPAQRGEFQRLLGNVLFALRGDGALPVLDIFLWPMLKQPQLDRSGAAARETLASYIQAQVERHSVHTLLLLGAAAQQWVERDAEGLRCVRSVSALGCLREPAQKRQLWQDIRHLAAVH